MEVDTEGELTDRREGLKYPDTRCGRTFIPSIVSTFSFGDRQICILIAIAIGPLRSGYKRAAVDNDLLRKVYGKVMGRAVERYSRRNVGFEEHRSYVVHVRAGPSVTGAGGHSGCGNGGIDTLQGA